MQMSWLSKQWQNWQTSKHLQTITWAAQRHGRPAEYSWHPLFNAAKFGWCPLLECRAVTKPRREKRSNLLGCPKTTELISATSGPKFTILWGHVGEILLSNMFFFRLSLCALVAKISPKLCDGAQMANFWQFYTSCTFSEPQAARFRPAS